MRRTPIWTYVFACIVVLTAVPRTLLSEESGDSVQGFAPTWKLLDAEAKRQFIAGYLFAFSDAARITDIALEYIKENPQGAVSGLEQIRSVYDMRGVTPDMVVHELDVYFREDGGKEATLSQAVTAVRSQLGQ
jgi:hypothetical protein